MMFFIETRCTIDSLKFFRSLCGVQTNKGVHVCCSKVLYNLKNENKIAL